MYSGAVITITLYALYTQSPSVQAVTSGKLAKGAVTTSKIATGAVATGKIRDGAVTLDKVVPALSNAIGTYCAPGDTVVGTGGPDDRYNVYQCR